jgi:transcriptional regulator of acetoin/glycerol metabolism
MKLTPYKLAKLKAEIKEIGEAMDKTNGKVGEAAKLLQIDRKTIYNKLKIFRKWELAQIRKKPFPKAEAP